MNRYQYFLVEKKKAPYLELWTKYCLRLITLQVKKTKKQNKNKQNKNFKEQVLVKLNINPNTHVIKELVIFPLLFTVNKIGVTKYPRFLIHKINTLIYRIWPNYCTYAYKRSQAIP